MDTTTTVRGLTKGNFLYTTIFDIQVLISGVLRGLSSTWGVARQIFRQWLKARKGVVWPPVEDVSLIKTWDFEC